MGFWKHAVVPQLRTHANMSEATLYAVSVRPPAQATQPCVEFAEPFRSRAARSALRELPMVFHHPSTQCDWPIRVLPDRSLPDPPGRASAVQLGAGGQCDVDGAAGRHRRDAGRGDALSGIAVPQRGAGEHAVV